MHLAEILLGYMTPDVTQATLIEDFQVFLSHIEWSHWVFKSLLVFHICYLVATCVAVHKAHLPSIITLSIVTSESINNYFASHRRWQTVLGFKDNYFRDRSGAFISIVWSAPFIITGLWSMILMLIKTSSLLVKVKRLERARKRKDE
eukprot:Blabericola_migrator_1__12972@NODE_860_length_6237_cov_124_199352_g610_i0_p6_GENE_NODE_860_length_6237_cov_124_199352_g610_i0NODE_860_length_6237_cov_124_199352_g610_i0_p6_ORF_typecomplete_len147_score10_61TMEM18/PF14770_6/8_3e20_NODE_860_length_6237_cov_124_199352_g610_i040154455